MNKKTRIIVGIISIVLLIGIGSLAWYLASVKNYKDKVASIRIDSVDLSQIPDGTYPGEGDVDFIYDKVEVTVQTGRITDIKLLEHKNGKGKSAEQIIDDIITKQSLDVDAVSGATNSSIVIKKAVENALKGIGE